MSNMERLVIAICLVALLGFALALPARAPVPAHTVKCAGPNDQVAPPCLAATAEGQPQRGAQMQATTETRARLMGLGEQR